MSDGLLALDDKKPTTKTNWKQLTKERVLEVVDFHSGAAFF